MSKPGELEIESPTVSCRGFGDFTPRSIENHCRISGKGLKSMFFWKKSVSHEEKKANGGKQKLGIEDRQG